MRLFIDTNKVQQFTVTRGFAPKADPMTGVLKTDRRTGQELNTIQLMALDENGGEVITVTVAGAVREVPVGSQVTVVDLEALPWNNNGRSGVAFRADVRGSRQRRPRHFRRPDIPSPRTTHDTNRRHRLTRAHKGART